MEKEIERAGYGIGCVESKCQRKAVQERLLIDTHGYMFECWRERIVYYTYNKNICCNQTVLSVMYFEEMWHSDVG